MQHFKLSGGIPEATLSSKYLNTKTRKNWEVAYGKWRIRKQPVATDGRTICGSENSKHKACHVVSAYGAENQITLGQLATEEKSNEMTAISELIGMLDIRESTVTLDAMGRQKLIAAKIPGTMYWG